MLFLGLGGGGGRGLGKCARLMAEIAGKVAALGPQPCTLRCPAKDSQGQILALAFRGNFVKTIESVAFARAHEECARQMSEIAGKVALVLIRKIPPLFLWSCLP